MKQNKNLKYYMSLNYPFATELYEDDGKCRFGMEIPDLPGVWADGKTIEEAYSSLVESKRLWFKTRLKQGMDIPEPVSEEDYSGKFILRPGPRLHMELSKGAKQNKKSLNQYITSLLESQISNIDLAAEIKSLCKVVSEQSRAIIQLQTEVRSFKHREDDLIASLSIAGSGFTRQKPTASFNFRSQTN